MRLPKCPGFTLIELMFSVATLAILATVSVPGLNSMLQENAAEALLNDLARTMSKARTSAVFQGQTVTMCGSKDNHGCNGNWHDGILVFLDPDGNHVVNSTDEILHVTAALTQLVRDATSRCTSSIAPIYFRRMSRVLRSAKVI